MFEFEPDEYIFTKFANYFKRRKKKQHLSNLQAAKLEDLKPRLTIFARAITGKSIDIYDADREGGYKDNNFFLPTYVSFFESIDDNISFYLFRVLYVSVQKNLKLNWNDEVEYELSVSQQQAMEASGVVLKSLFEQFPISATFHSKFLNYFTSKATEKQPLDLTFLYGKFMNNSKLDAETAVLKNFSEKVKEADKNDITTILKAKAVEEIKSVAIDNKQQEDAVLQHQFEKVETAEEFGGNFKDFDGDDDLDDHSNALEDLNMKYTVRVDDTAHSVYQAEFTENTTVSESAEKNTNAYHIKYDEWDYAKRKYKKDFCKVYPKTILDTDVAYYKKTISENQSTLTSLRKMLSTVNNKYKQQRRQSQGDEYDLDALTDLFVDIKSNRTPSENIYLSKKKKEKNISILLLLDISLSTDGYAAGNRVIDVEKQVSILFGEILNEYNIDFSIDCFYSKTRNHSSYVSIKGFDESWNATKVRVGAIEPNGYTRIGAALRHSGALLKKRETKNKWVILLALTSNVGGLDFQTKRLQNGEF